MNDNVFISELNNYLEYPLKAHGERKVLDLLHRYKSVIEQQNNTTYKLEVPVLRLKVDDVRQSVCAMYDVTPDDLISSSREQNKSMARFVFSYVLYKYMDFPMAAIGRILGGRHHTTILNGLRVVTNMCKYDVPFRAKIIALEEQIEKLIDNG